MWQWTWKIETNLSVLKASHILDCIGKCYSTILKSDPSVYILVREMENQLEETDKMSMKEKRI